MLHVAVVVIFVVVVVVVVHSFPHPARRLSNDYPQHFFHPETRKHSPNLFYNCLVISSKRDNRNDDTDDDDDDDAIDLSNQDWRTFRAKLVMGSSSSSSRNQTKTTNSGASVSSFTITTGIDQNNDDPNNNNNQTKTGVDDFDGIGAIFDTMDTRTENPEQRPTTASTTGLLLSPLDPSQWAYDSGQVIERGAVILGGVEQDYGFGLRQQYFHKAAIFVLDHDENTFTKGIILNRPTDLMLDDTLNPGVKWQVWYGGDVQGLSSLNPEIVCLHTLKDPQVTRVSIPVMNDIQWTTFDVAKQLVRKNLAKSTDFWVFCGYAGWGPKQLMGELERKSWYMVATDAQTLLKELARLSSNVDPRDAGLETWSLLMNMIGRSETAEEHTGDFDDYMLKEWALKHLLSVAAGGGAETTNNGMGGLVTKLSSSPPSLSNPLDRLLQRVSVTDAAESITAGTVVRASPMERSPFLLESQEFHKSIVLIVSDDENLTVGVILNRPGAKGLDVRMQEKKSGEKSSSQLKVPLRYGGQFAIKGTESLLWLHCHPVLKAAKIGSPIGNANGIWKCSANDMISVVGKGLVTPDVFIVVAGVSVWMKGYSLSDTSHGMQGEIRIGNYEVVPPSKVSLMFDELIQQEVLTEENLNKNLIIADRAWKSAAPKEMTKRRVGSSIRIPIGGLGEGYDEDDDEFVYKTDVKVAKLCDDALRSWVATFLLGAPSLGE